MTRPKIMDDWAHYSQLRLDELKGRLSGVAPESQPVDLAVFCAGSYARLKASKYSDIDLLSMRSTAARAR